MRIARIAFFVLLVSALPAAAALSADGAIERVTVFQDRAEVTRVATVVLPPGETVVEFGKLPQGVDADSLRLRTIGAGIEVGAVEVVERIVHPAETGELRDARNELQAIRDRRAELVSKGNVDARLRHYLEAVGTGTAKGIAEGDKADPASLVAIYELLEQKLGALGDAERAREKEERELAGRETVAAARVASLERPAGVRERVATVELSANEARSTRLELSYVTPNAWWRPSYRAGLDVEAAEVQLTAEAVIRQRTGENWSGVALSVSTAAPAAGVEPPKLVSRMLQTWLPGITEEMQVITAGAAAEFSRYQGGFANVLKLAPGTSDADGETDHAEKMAAEAKPKPVGMVRSAYNVRFEVTGDSSVPSDDREHRVRLRDTTLPARVVHRSVPEMSELAYLTAEVVSPEAYPLPAGPVRVFAGGAFLGSYRTSEIAPATEWTIPFGIDNRVAVERLPQPRQRDTRRKNAAIEYAFKTRIQNRQDRPITLILEDRLPVTEDERITVAVDKATTPGSKDSKTRPGVKLWSFDLEPGEEREVMLAYSVEHPTTLPIHGLE